MTTIGIGDLGLAREFGGGRTRPSEARTGHPVLGWWLFGVEADGVQDGFLAGADLVEFLGGDVVDAGNFAAAEVVDGEVEAVAGAGAGGVDLVALGDADVALLVVAVGEGDAGDRGSCPGLMCGMLLDDGVVLPAGHRRQRRSAA